MKKYLILLTVLCWVWGAGTAGAVVYHYDFSAMGFADGQSLEGVTRDYAAFSSETNDLRYYTAYGSGIATGAKWGGAGDTHITFSRPVSRVSFRAGDGSGDDDAFAVTLYAFGTDALIGTWSSPVFGGRNEPEWYTLNITAATIGRVVFDPGNSGVLPGVKGVYGGMVITDMSYNTVPVPSSLLLLAPGLLGLWGALRRFGPK